MNFGFENPTDKTMLIRDFTAPVALWFVFRFYYVAISKNVGSLDILRSSVQHHGAAVDDLSGVFETLVTDLLVLDSIISHGKVHHFVAIVDPIE